jgi:hypothetical protein
LVATDVAARGLGKYCTEAKGLNYIVWSHLTSWGPLLPFLGHDLSSVVTQFFKLSNVIFFCITLHVVSLFQTDCIVLWNVDGLEPSVNDLPPL